MKLLQHAVRLVKHAVRGQGKRSSKWPAVEKEHLAKNPKCASCGGTERLNVHHKKPYHLDPSLELDPENLITLCMAVGRHCHLLIGHGDNFKAYVPEVTKYASYVSALVPYGPQVVEDAITKFSKETKELRQFSL